jgi:ribose transport system permease protein
VIGRPRAIGRLGWVLRQRWVWPFGGAIALWLTAAGLTGHVSLKLLLLNATLATFLALAGVAQMVVVTSGPGSFDLSIPYVIVLSAFVASAVMHAANGRLLLGIGAGLGVGIGAGLLNGLLVIGPKIPPIVATLSVGYILFTPSLELQEPAAAGPSPSLVDLVHREIDGASPVLLVTLVICVAMAFIFTGTVFGKQLHAVGQNREAARLAGVRINRVLLAVYVLSGFLAACVGILLAAYNAGAFIGMGNVYLLGSLAAIVLGGTPVVGGVSSVAGTAIGALVLTLLITVLQLSNLGIGWQYILEGVVVILVVTITSWRGRRTV